jgi:hypothetical protein
MVALGERLSEITLRDLNGTRVVLAAPNGRVRVIVFWSADCPVVRRGEARLAALREAWPLEVEVFYVASNADEPIAVLVRQAKARDVAPVLIDESARLADLLGATTTPQAFVVDGESRLRYRGAVDDSTMRRNEPTRHFLADAVTALLAGDSPDPAETPAYGCAIVREIG